jgi:TrmH family RNA methyltransferase
MKMISSRHNEEIIAITKLKHKKYRDQHKQFYAEGVRTCSTLITSGIQMVMLYATERGYQQLQEYAVPTPITLVTPHVMEKISDAQQPSGIFGVFKQPQEKPLSAITSGIVLADISDPGNMGTLIRSCAAFGAQSVVTIEGTDMWHPKVVQASAGTHGYVSMFTTTWDTLIKEKPDQVTLTALVPHGGQLLSTYQPHSAHNLLVIGNEAHGIPAEWLQQCDQSVTIAMPGNTESLNAAVAGSIALYAFFAKRL